GAPCLEGGLAFAGNVRVGRAAAPRILVLATGTVAIDPVCPPVAARIRATRKPTRLRATWTDCPGVTGRVRLEARLAAPACEAVHGRLSMRGRPRAHRIVAARSPYDVPLDPRSPWPKFRRTPAQDGPSPLRPGTGG